MSLYWEAGEVIDTAIRSGGSLRSIVFSKKDCKNDRKTLFALTTEAAKWSEILSEVINRSGILTAEKQLTATSALLLTHDHLLSKKGIALPPKHGLYVAVARHKARLSAELTKVRLRRGFATLTALREHVDGGSISHGQGRDRYLHPRWVRVNILRTTLDEQLSSTFAEYKRTESLSEITSGQLKDKLVYLDKDIPTLLAIPAHLDVTNSVAYKKGQLILQDKASCFPAYLLSPDSEDGDILDACAAPGNKTTHLAALTSITKDSSDPPLKKRRIFACERDSLRSETLRKMVKLAGADDVVHILANQDFVKLNPRKAEFANVTALLLDPSCSGSGIVGRDEANLIVHLPDSKDDAAPALKSRKRKRSGKEAGLNSEPETLAADIIEEEVSTELKSDHSNLEARLSALSSFQLHLLEHAMEFPAAKRITYSTCSVYTQENENVVAKALTSGIAVKRGWRIMRRDEQVEDLKEWKRRGNLQAVAEIVSKSGHFEKELNADVIAEACIRCDKSGEDSTMGFFVAGFVRDVDSASAADAFTTGNGMESSDEENESKDDGTEWSGFSEDEN